MRNVLRYLPVIWHDSEADYDGLLEFMEVKLRSMREWQKPGLTLGSVNAPKHYRQLTICSELCRRLREDDYYRNAGYAGRRDPEDRRDKWSAYSPAKQQRIARHSHYMQMQDQRMLGEVMGKHLLWWWY